MANERNKGRIKVVFEPGDWVQLHLRKESFPKQRHFKLQPRGDGPFQVVARVNDNADKLDLPSEYNVSATFYVSDLIPFDYEGGDLRANPFEEGGSDAKDHGDHDRDNMNQANSKDKEESMNSASTRFDPLSYNGGPITRARAKKMKEAIIGLILHHLEPLLTS